MRAPASLYDVTLYKSLGIAAKDLAAAYLVNQQCGNETSGRASNFDNYELF